MMTRPCPWTRWTHIAWTLAGLLTTCGCASNDLESPQGDEGRPGPRPTLDLGGLVDDGAPRDATAEVDLGAQDMGQVSDADTTPDQAQTLDMAHAPDLATPTEPSCAQRLRVDQTWQIDQSGVLPHYYARAAADGESLWIVYARHESDLVRATSIFAVQLRCDGSVITGPFKVNADSGTKNIEPNIALGDETVFISYTKEVDGAQRVYLRTFTRQGAPRSMGEHDVTPRGPDGVEPISSLVWENDLAALPGDQAVLVASYFAAESGSFQILAQRVRSSGQREGQAFFPKKDKGVEQTRPSVTALADGTVYVSWSRVKPAQDGQPEQPMRVVYATFAPGQTQPDARGPFPANPASTAKNELGRYAKERLSAPALFLTFQTEDKNNIMVKDGAFGASPSLGTAGQDQRYDHRPDVAAASASAGALAWLRADGSPTRNQLLVQPLTRAADGAITLGREQRIPTAQPVRPAGNYGVSLRHVQGSTYLLTWSEGASTSDAKLMARLITLP